MASLLRRAAARAEQALWAAAMTIAAAGVATAQPVATTTTDNLNVNGQGLLDYIVVLNDDGSIDFSEGNPQGFCPVLDGLGAARSPEQVFLNERCANVAFGPNQEDRDRVNDALQGDEIASQLQTSVNVVAQGQSNAVAARLNEISGRSGLAALQEHRGRAALASLTLNDETAYSMAGANDQDEFAGDLGSRLGVFVNANYSFGDRDETTLEPGLDYDAYSFTVGADYAVTDNLVLGLAAGYGNLDIEYDLNAGDSDADSFSVFGYGFTSFTDNIGATFSAGYSRVEYNTDRILSFTDASGVVDEVASSDTSADQINLSAQVFYDAFVGSYTVTPYAGFDYLGSWIDGFRESDAGGLGLQFEDQSLTSAQSSLGVNVSRAVVFDSFTASLSARGEWVHEFSDEADTVSYRYIFAPTADLNNNAVPLPTFRSEEPASDFARFGVGLSLAFGGGFSAFADYEALAFYDDYTGHSVTIGGRYDF